MTVITAGISKLLCNVLPDRHQSISIWPSHLQCCWRRTPTAPVSQTPASPRRFLRTKVDLYPSSPLGKCPRRVKVDVCHLASSWLLLRSVLVPPFHPVSLLVCWTVGLAFGFWPFCLRLLPYVAWWTRVAFSSPNVPACVLFVQGPSSSLPPSRFANDTSNNPKIPRSDEVLT